MGRAAKAAGGPRAYRANAAARVFWRQLERCRTAGELRRLRATVARQLHRTSPEGTPRGAGRGLAAVLGEIDGRLGGTHGRYDDDGGGG